MYGLLLTIALGAPCDQAPPLRERIESAFRQYNDAEVQQAKQILTETYGELVCAQRVVTSAELLDLYRADGLVSISLSDNRGSVYATLRAVAVDHEGGAPPEAYGPYLSELYETWAGRAAAELIEVSVDGGGTVYVDGRPAAYGVPVTTTPGEHLIQIESAGTYRNQVLDLSTDHVVSTGLPVPPDAIRPEPEPVVAAPVPAPAPEPAPVVPEIEMLDPVEPPERRRRHPVWAFGGAAVAAGGAGFALGSAVLSQQRLTSGDYEQYGTQREQVIRSDQQAIRAAYGVGIGLSAVSAGLLTVGIVGVKVQARPGGIVIGGRL